MFLIGAIGVFAGKRAPAQLGIAIMVLVFTWFWRKNLKQGMADMFTNDAWIVDLDPTDPDDISTTETSENLQLEYTQPALRMDVVSRPSASNRSSNRSSNRDRANSDGASLITVSAIQVNRGEEEEKPEHS